MKKLIGLGVLVLCAMLMLVGCGSGVAEEEVCIVGSWKYVKTMVDGEEEPVIVPELEQFPPWFAVNEDGEILMELFFELEDGWTYETALAGVLVRTEPLRFTITEQRRVSDAGVEEMQDAYLLYNPEDGLLRYTMTPMPGQPVTYTYFERDLSND